MAIRITAVVTLILAMAACWILPSARGADEPAAATPPAAPATPPRVKLWDVTPDLVAGPDREADPTEPTLDIFLPPKDKASGAAIVVLPGGGYTNLSTVKEGSDVARMLNGHGIAAFVLRYRHAPRYHDPAPRMDASRAMRIVRSRAEEFGIDSKRIGIMGFSAGGHLAATMATQFDAGKSDAADAIEKMSSRPDFAILVYPVITFTQESAVHKGSRTALVGADEKLRTAMSAELNVTPQTPPTFLVHASTDNTVPVENSVLFYLACRKNKVPVEMHIFENGPHGFGLAPNDPVLRTWPDLLAQWMKANKWVAG